MMKRLHLSLLGGGLLCVLAVVSLQLRAGEPAGAKEPVKGLDALESLDWQLPNEKWMRSFAERQPIYFVSRTSNPEEWLELEQFWNETTEKVLNPYTGKEVTRKAVKIKLPLGLSRAPDVPAANEMTLDRWQLGKELYFDPILSSDGTVSCATCHNPQQGWTDQSAVSLGIGGKRGGVSAPPVLNSAYNALQFWDGRAISLEDQAQGPVGNPLEMFGGDGHAWREAVRRVRRNPKYVEGFKRAYGVEPTRDAIAKAIAVYERTVLSANAVVDRAEFAKALRAAEAGVVEDKARPVDYEKVLREAFENKDFVALRALKLDPAKDRAKIPAVAKSIYNGQQVFFGKARCNSCHVGDNFTDNQFHNLGVGVNKHGQLPRNGLGRYEALPTGAKDPALVGAFKTPHLRGLVDTFPYLHDGSEETLAKVIEFYDRGGNANRYLDLKMRDFDAEKAYIQARDSGNLASYKGPQPQIFGPDQTPIIPLRLNLTAQEKLDLEMFLRALQGDPVDPVVANQKSTKQ